MKTTTHIVTACTLLLLVLWIPVALDKFWDLPGFHRTLLRQPFPDAWADVLYWLLPILELLCAVLLVGDAVAKPTTNRLKQKGFALSALLLLGFTVFILLGVLGWYDKRPCGSVISGLSWEQHLWFNLMFLMVSVAGWWLACSGQNTERDDPKVSVPTAKPSREKGEYPSQNVYKRFKCFRRLKRFKYPRRFALFPGRPVGQQRIPSHTLDSMGAASRMDAGEHTRPVVCRQKRLQTTV